jgi:hypothetical protein
VKSACQYGQTVFPLKVQMAKQNMSPYLFARSLVVIAFGNRDENLTLFELKFSSFVLKENWT